MCLFFIDWYDKGTEEVIEGEAIEGGIYLGGKLLREDVIEVKFIECGSNYSPTFLKNSHFKKPFLSYFLR